MLGKEFRDKLKEYLSFIGQDHELKESGLVERKPDQSKHLETASVCLFYKSIDFVNLRSEDYCENSRIPTMKFGTAKEDRRDLTINSMFYNIHTNSIEDFTQRGIAGLKSGKIETPLPPKQTFLDDPLRVLRAIPFGARFGFELNRELKMAAAVCDVKAAIAHKIRRERIGIEINRMLEGKQPVMAMAYISEFRLFWSVFTLPPGTEPSPWEGCEMLCFAYMDYLWRFLQLVGFSSFTDDQQRLCLYAALLLPFRNSVYNDEKSKKVGSLHDAAGKFMFLIPSIILYENNILQANWIEETPDFPVALKHIRILAGSLLCEMKEHWCVCLMLGLLFYPSDIVCGRNLLNDKVELSQRKELFDRVKNAFLKMGLLLQSDAVSIGLKQVNENDVEIDVWKLEFVDGNDIMSILEIKEGPEVKEWKRKLTNWRLAHSL